MLRARAYTEPWRRFLHGIRASRPPRTDLLLLAVAAGVFLLWIQVDPAHEGPATDAYYGGMGNGLESVHGIVLLPIVVLLSMAVFAGWRSRRVELVVGVVGAVVVLRFTQLWDETFVSAVGAWVMLVGCPLLAGIAAVDVVRERRLPTLARSS